MMFEMNQSIARHYILKVSILTIALMLFSGAAEGQERRAVMADSHAKIFRNHCYDCHDSDSEEAGVNLEDISFDVADSLENAELWQKILNSINSGEMPPEDEEQIPSEEKADLVDDLGQAMVALRKKMSDLADKYRE